MDETFDDLNETEVEAPGGTQATHSSTGRRGRGRMDSLKRHARPAIRYVQDRDFGEMRNDLQDEIREHPIRSLVLAVGAGYLLSKIID